MTNYPDDDIPTEDYQLLISFPDQSESFVNGFEAGRAYAQMEAGVQEIRFAGHAQNMDVFLRMSAAMKYDMTETVCEDGDGRQHPEWMDYEFVPGAAMPPLRSV